RIGHRVGEPHQVGVVAGRVDDDDVVVVLDRGDRPREAGELARLIGVDGAGLASLHADMGRNFERRARALGPIAAVLDVMGEALLAAVEIDGGDPLTGLEQRDRYMQRRRRLTRTALLVSEHDYVRGLAVLTDRPHQHERPPLTGLSSKQYLFLVKMVLV